MCKQAIYWFSAFFVALAAYSLGVTGGFLLDDNTTLQSLANWGAVESLGELWHLWWVEASGPTGRPIALLSFVLQAGSWPQRPEDYLFVNVGIHLINSCLLLWFFRGLLQKAEVASGNSIALLAAIFWMLHPSHVSTVLYVVQRMTQLEVMFNLLALLAYLEFRKQLLIDNIRSSFLCLSLVAICALLALLSKESAALIPLQILVLELFFYWAIKDDFLSRFKLIKWGLIGLPCAVIAIFLIYTVASYSDSGFQDYRRGFTVLERLLTQFRVIGDYLVMFFIPSHQGAGVFYDGYEVSKGLFEPLTTFVWLVIHSLFLFLAYFFRRVLPVVSLSILWFYAGHVLESTVVQLELKYEHRNYLPSMGLALLMAFAVVRYSANKKVLLVVSFMLVVIFSSLLASRASLWGEPKVAAVVWVNENPQSLRALFHAVTLYRAQPDGADVANYYHVEALKLSGGEAALELSYFLSNCKELNLAESYISSRVKYYEYSPFNFQIATAYAELLDKMVSGGCPKFTYVMFDRLIAASIKNKNYKVAGTHLRLRLIRARAELILGTRQRAVAKYERILKRDVLTLDFAVREAGVLATHGQQQLGYNILNKAILTQQGESPFMVSQAQEILQKIKDDI